MGNISRYLRRRESQEFREDKLNDAELNLTKYEPGTLNYRKAQEDYKVSKAMLEGETMLTEAIYSELGALNRFVSAPLIDIFTDVNYITDRGDELSAMRLASALLDVGTGGLFAKAKITGKMALASEGLFNIYDSYIDVERMKDNGENPTGQDITNTIMANAVAQGTLMGAGYLLGKGWDKYVMGEIGKRIQKPGKSMFAKPDPKDPIPVNVMTGQSVREHLNQAVGYMYQDPTYGARYEWVKKYGKELNDPWYSLRSTPYLSKEGDIRPISTKAQRNKSYYKYMNFMNRRIADILENHAGDPFPYTRGDAIEEIYEEALRHEAVTLLMDARMKATEIMRIVKERGNVAMNELEISGKDRAIRDMVDRLFARFQDGKYLETHELNLKLQQAMIRSEYIDHTKTANILDAINVLADEGYNPSEAMMNPAIVQGRAKEIAEILSDYQYQNAGMQVEWVGNPVDQRLAEDLKKLGIDGLVEQVGMDEHNMPIYRVNLDQLGSNDPVAWITKKIEEYNATHPGEEFDFERTVKVVKDAPNKPLIKDSELTSGTKFHEGVKKQIRQMAKDGGHNYEELLDILDKSLSPRQKSFMNMALDNRDLTEVFPMEHYPHYYDNNGIFQIDLLDESLNSESGHTVWRAVSKEEYETYLKTGWVESGKKDVTDYSFTPGGALKHGKNNYEANSVRYKKVEIGDRFFYIRGRDKNWVLKNGDPTISPYIDRDGNLIHTGNDHLDFAEANGFDSTADFKRDAGVLRAGFFSEGGFVDLLQGQKISRKQYDFLVNYLDNNYDKSLDVNIEKLDNFGHEVVVDTITLETGDDVRHFFADHLETRYTKPEPAYLLKVKTTKNNGFEAFSDGTARTEKPVGSDQVEKVYHVDYDGMPNASRRAHEKKGHQYNWGKPTIHTVKGSSQKVDFGTPIHREFTNRDTTYYKPRIQTDADHIINVFNRMINQAWAMEVNSLDRKINTFVDKQMVLRATSILRDYGDLHGEDFHILRERKKILKPEDVPKQVLDRLRKLFKENTTGLKMNSMGRQEKMTIPVRKRKTGVLNGQVYSPAQKGRVEVDLDKDTFADFLRNNGYLAPGMNDEQIIQAMKRAMGDVRKGLMENVGQSVYDETGYMNIAQAFKYYADKYPVLNTMNYQEMTEEDYYKFLVKRGEAWYDSKTGKYYDVYKDVKTSNPVTVDFLGYYDPQENMMVMLKGYYRKTLGASEAKVLTKKQEQLVELATLRHEVEHALDFLTLRRPKAKKFYTRAGGFVNHVDYRKALKSMDESTSLREMWNEAYGEHFVNYVHKMWEAEYLEHTAIAKGIVDNLGDKAHKTIKGAPEYWNLDDDAELLEAVDEFFLLQYLTTNSQGHRATQKWIAKHLGKDYDHYMHLMAELGGGSGTASKRIMSAIDEQSYFRQFGMNKRRFYNMFSRETMEEARVMAGGGMNVNSHGEGAKKTSLKVGTDYTTVEKVLGAVRDEFKSRVSGNQKKKFDQLHDKPTLQLIRDMITVGTGYLIGGGGSKEAFTGRAMILTNRLFTLINGKGQLKYSDFAQDIAHELMGGFVDYAKLGVRGTMRSVEALSRGLFGANIEETALLKTIERLTRVNKGDIKNGLSAINIHSYKRMVRDMLEMQQGQSTARKRFNRWASLMFINHEEGDFLGRQIAEQYVARDMAEIVNKNLELEDLNEMQKLVIFQAGGQTKERYAEIKKTLKLIMDENGQINLHLDGYNPSWFSHSQRATIDNIRASGIHYMDSLHAGRNALMNDPMTEGVTYLMKSTLAIMGDTWEHLTGKWDNGVYRRDTGVEAMYRLLGLGALALIPATGLGVAGALEDVIRGKENARDIAKNQLEEFKANKLMYIAKNVGYNSQFSPIFTSRSGTPLNMIKDIAGNLDEPVDKPFEFMETITRMVIGASLHNKYQTLIDVRNNLTKEEVDSIMAEYMTSEEFDNDVQTLWDDTALDLADEVIAQEDEVLKILKSKK